MALRNSHLMPRNHEGQSVASMWGEMVAAAERGEVVTVANKFGADVAVMMSKEEYERLVQEAEHEWCHYSAEDI